MKWTKEMIKERENGVNSTQFEIIAQTLNEMKEIYFRELDYSKNLTTQYDREGAKERADRAHRRYFGALEILYNLMSKEQWEKVIEKSSWV